MADNARVALIERAFQVGAGKIKVPHSEEQRALFESFMNGHCWRVGEWVTDAGREPHYNDMTSRMLWAVWRDCAATHQVQPSPTPGQQSSGGGAVSVAAAEETVAEILGRVPTVARLYYSGSASRRYRRASTQSGPGEPLVTRAAMELEIRKLVAQLAINRT